MPCTEQASHCPDTFCYQAVWRLADRLASGIGWLSGAGESSAPGERSSRLPLSACWAVRSGRLAIAIAPPYVSLSAPKAAQAQQSVLVARACLHKSEHSQGSPHAMAAHDSCNGQCTVPVAIAWDSSHLWLGCAIGMPCSGCEAGAPPRGGGGPIAGLMPPCTMEFTNCRHGNGELCQWGHPMEHTLLIHQAMPRHRLTVLLLRRCERVYFGALSLSAPETGYPAWRYCTHCQTRAETAGPDTTGSMGHNISLHPYRWVLNASARCLACAVLNFSLLCHCWALAWRCPTCCSAGNG
jgi:hypothetical protein